jgi:propionate CoA-transferase
MNPITKVQLVAQLIRWLVVKNRRDIDFRPRNLANPKFKSARDAIRMIPDGAVVMSAGMASNMRAAILFSAVGDVFDATGHPKSLTWVSTGAMGGRSRIRGTVEEVARPGLCDRFISGHHETAHAMLKAGAEGRIELHTLPQGIITHLAEGQGTGRQSLLSTIGMGTFLDPRVGTGSAVTPNASMNLVEAVDGHLQYSLPKITAACVLATEADVEGNIYMKTACLYTEVREAVLAAKANGGVSIVTVASIIPKDEAAIFLPADKVDAIVVCPANEQTLTIPQLKHWKMFLPGARENVAESMEKLDFFNGLLKLDPVRGPVENAMARSAAAQFAKIGHPGMHVINGYGLPIVVGRFVDVGGLTKDVRFLIETGAYGGVPAPGLFFGTALNPDRLSTSAEMFRYCADNLDVTVLGMLQADSLGNVNVSKKSARIQDYVGPGGFPDLVSAAKAIIFVGAFQARSQTVVEGGRIRVVKTGIPKFVEHVDEVTFYGPEAIKKGQKVFYVTPLCTLQLTARGLELIEVMPGVDVKKDILDASPARILLPESGTVPVAPAAYLTGEGFRLAWGKGVA